MIQPGVFTDETKKSDFHDEVKFQINNVNTAIMYHSSIVQTPPL